MTEEEYNKLVQEREEYKKQMNQRHYENNMARRNFYNEFQKNLIRTANPHKSDEELEKYQNFGDDNMYNFYSGEINHLDNFFKRLKGKIFKQK